MSLLRFVGDGSFGRLNLDVDQMVNDTTVHYNNRIQYTRRRIKNRGKTTTEQHANFSRASTVTRAVYGMHVDRGTVTHSTAFSLVSTFDVDRITSGRLLLPCLCVETDPKLCNFCALSPELCRTRILRAFMQTRLVRRTA
jgi:hypothetical protein